MTVVWSRSKKRPISDSESVVWRRIRYIAICRGSATELVRRLPLSWSRVMP
jgi:hypothetical protein